MEELGPDSGDMTVRRLRRLAVWVMVLGSVIIVGALALSELERRDVAGATGIAVADYRAQAVPEEGTAPPFELPSLDGYGTVSLAPYRGKVVVLNFWASWCAPCWQEAPGLQRVWERYRSLGVQFLGVNERDDQASARSFVEENGLTFPSASDPSGELAFSYSIAAMPTTFVIAPTGQLAYRLIGYADERALRAILDEMLTAGR